LSDHKFIIADISNPLLFYFFLYIIDTEHSQLRGELFGKTVFLREMQRGDICKTQKKQQAQNQTPFSFSTKYFKEKNQTQSSECR